MDDTTLALQEIREMLRGLVEHLAENGLDTEVELIIDRKALKGLGSVEMIYEVGKVRVSGK